MSAADAGHLAVQSIRHDALTLDVRPAVAIRERVIGGKVFIYLSLYANEIDTRFDLLAEHFHADPENWPQAVELTDAAILLRDSQLIIVRGGACAFPLYRKTGKLMHLSTRLPLDNDIVLSRRGLLASMLMVLLPGSHEPNFLAATPVAGWQRIRRGAVTRLGSRTCQETLIDHSLGPLPATRIDISHAISAAFEQYGTSQQSIASSIVELSGGYDSTLAAALALRPGHRMSGVSVEFPYYEFRFESAVQQAVGAALGVSRNVLDGTLLHPYSAWDTAPRFDEPALFVTGIRHAQAVARYAEDFRAERIYTGHGGDHVFAMDLSASERVTADLHSGVCDSETKRELSRLCRQLQGDAWLKRTTGCFLYDGRQDVLSKEGFGVTLRTPFTDLAVFKAGIAWSLFSSSQGMLPDKSILDEAVGKWLPAAVTERRGKVAYDGVWMRAYAEQHQHIANLLDSAAPLLERIGLTPRWLLQQARALSEWHPGAEREVLGAYALAAWFSSWGFERFADCQWQE